MSYAHKDGAWAKTLAENLHRLGLDVWLDQWEMAGGQLVASQLQEGLANADAVVAVVSPYWIESGWCGEEFAAAMTGAVEQGKRLIPVVVGEADLPPFLASRLYIDFRETASSDQYLDLVRQVEQAVRRKPSAQRPGRGEPLVVPDSVTYRPDGPTRAELRIGTDSVCFSAAGQEISVPQGGDDEELQQRLGTLHRARAAALEGVPTRRLLMETAALGGPAGALAVTGKVLGERFAGGAVAAAMVEHERLARARHTSLRIGLAVDDPEWVDLPWETLTVPGMARPLVLSEQVELYRTMRGECSPVAVRVPGPLRILAVVASPESGGGELLDYELELGRILDAVDPARSRQGAYVRVLNWGSVAEIRTALDQERFHILHLSCHAKPGVLLLEDERGKADEVDAQRFLTEVLPSDRGVPLVVLAGCSTARAPAQQQDDSGTDPAAAGVAAASEEGLVRAGLARELLAHGVPAVLAMTDSVTDHYATELAAEIYQRLARAEHPNPLTALSQARRVLEARRQQLPDQDPRAAWPEWATPALFLAGPPLPLFDRAHSAYRVPVLAETVLDEGMVVRKVGDFVGRRAELRGLLSALRDPDRAGVLVHGMGGVGKSTLAAELLHHYETHDQVIVPVSAATTRTVDAVLETLRQRLLSYCLVTEDLPETDPLRRTATALADASSPWWTRWQLIRQFVLPRVRLLMIVDNAEDLLDPASSDDDRQLKDAEFAELLAAWTEASPRTRLLITSRHPFQLPRQADERLLAHHLGPLSLAETRKLIWRLDGLAALSPADQRRAYTDVGGHPRALEYLDALLRGGEARFPDIARRMENALRARGIPDPKRWLTGARGDLDRALAETVTLSVDDVLLDSLLSRLDDVPGARSLLDGMAVYRMPVDRTGAAWQLSGPTTAPEVDPALVRRLEAVDARVTEARGAEAGPQGWDDLPPELIREYEAAWEELRPLPVTLDNQAANALKRLLDLGLLSPSPSPQDKPGSTPTGFTIHNWTADALRRRARPDDLKAAHRRAAAYWQWRVNVWPQSRVEDITQLIEVRHHHHQAADHGQADSVTKSVCDQLHIWGAWDWEQHLIEETLTWVPSGSPSASAYIHQLGMIAQLRGDYRQAEERYRASLSISEELGDRANIAIAYHQLGMIAELRGDYRQAEERYRASLTIKEELGDRAGIASTYHQLGMIAQLRGDYQQAEERYRASLTIKEELGNRAGIANSYGQLGVIAQQQGDYRQAEERYRASLTISEELGDRASIAIAYHQLGIIAELRGDYQQAEERYRASLTIEEELGNRAGIADSCVQLGVLRTKQQRPAEGMYYTLQGLSLQLEIGTPPGTALYWLREQRAFLGNDAFRSRLNDLLADDASTTVLMDATQPQQEDAEPTDQP
ncbi:tetratricopeptide repeat protein [Streptomyces justiciae]|uniref:Tetratricopeptide repeat protein n=1 Tax=Streptomyces justiciae TaxID=2780140 RepID=A0ABU3LTJ2_9ACTN|nr:tetratricopeptide repeat protein [Streptomyces justiciae]MDT7842566.1 tetratricopeptide repeat protein [Streptomyces justiciae]